MAEPIPILVGGPGPSDPAAGTSVVIMTSIAGQLFYLEKIGYGTFDRTLWSPRTGGGFTLTSGSFVAGEKFYIHLTGFSVTDLPQGAYTNGFDYQRVMAAMFGRIGWQQPWMAGSPVISNNNLQARGNRYFQDFHALVTVDNVKAVMEGPSATDLNLNGYLESIQRSAIMRCLNGVFREPELLEQVLLFDRIGQNDTPVDNTGLFIGYEINTAAAMDIGVQIESATLLFDQDVTFNLYLFKDGKKSAISVIEVSAEAYEATVVSFSDLVLNYIGAATKGTRFYLGYFQDDLGSARAVREEACGKSTKCFRAQPVSMKRIAGQYDFDRNQRSYLAQPYGINLEMSSFRDHTQQVVRKANLFDEVIGLTVTYTVIERILYTIRSNGNERSLRDQMDRVGMSIELTGVAPISEAPAKIKGIKERIDAEYARLRKTFFPRKASTIINLAEC